MFLYSNILTDTVHIESTLFSVSDISLHSLQHLHYQISDIRELQRVSTLHLVEKANHWINKKILNTECKKPCVFLKTTDWAQQKQLGKIAKEMTKPGQTPWFQQHHGDRSKFSSSLKTAQATSQRLRESDLLKPTLSPAPVATTKLICKLRLKRLSQLLHQSLHTRKTSVTEQENYINCVLKLPLWALHTNVLILVFKTSICCGKEVWKNAVEQIPPKATQLSRKGKSADHRHLCTHCEAASTFKQGLARPSSKGRPFTYVKWLERKVGRQKELFQSQNCEQVFKI